MADEPTPPADIPAEAPPPVETAQMVTPIRLEANDATPAPLASAQSGLAMEPQPHLTVNEPIPEPTPQAEASTPSEPAEPASEAVREPAAAPVESVQSESPEVPEAQTPVTRPAASAAQQAPANPALNTSPQVARELLVKARAKVQTQKQKKLDKIMAEIEKNGKISNDDVEKLLHCSDATASRYLSALEKQGKIKKVGTTGAGVVYMKA